MFNILNRTSANDVKMAYFPELFGAKRNTATTMAEIQAANPGLSDAACVQMAISGNTLNPTSATLWASISKNYVDAVSKRYADLAKFTYAQEPAMPLPQGVHGTINVKVLNSVGSALTDTTNWNQTAISQKYVPITVARKSRPAGLDSYDLANGERIETTIAALVDAVIAGCWATVAAKVAATLPKTLTATAAATATNAGVFVTNSSTWGPEVIAKQISTLYGDFAQPDVLALNPTLYGSVVPTNGLSLNPETEGVYGVRHIVQGAGMAAMATGNVGKGIAARRNAIGIATSLPVLDEFNVIATRYLGTIAGVPILLKTWVNPGSEQIFVSAETIFGAEVLAPQFLTVLV